MATTVIGDRARPQIAAPIDAIVFGVPVAWGLVLLFHPTGDGDLFYPIISEQVTRWMAVHLATMVFVPLMALVLLVLVRGIDSRAARISRAAAVVFAVFYTAWESILGVGTGILADRVSELPPGERATGAALVEDFAGSGVLRVLEYTGSLAWLVAVAAAALTLRTTLALHWGVVVLFVVSAPLITAHVPPIGPVGLLLFIAGAVIVRRHSTTSAGLRPR